MSKEELEKEAREYLAEHSEYSEVFGQTFVAVDTLTAMVDFAEPREKRIAELEMTVGTLRTFSNEQATCIERLEKENAELKGENKVLAQNLEDTEILNKTLVNRNAELKELLKQWLQNSNASGCDNVNIVTDTEQFLSEVEK